LLDELLEAFEQIRCVGGEVGAHAAGVDPTLEQLGHVGAIAHAVRDELHVDEHLDGHDGQLVADGLAVEHAADVRAELAHRQVVHTHAADVNRHSRAERDDAARVLLEGVVSDEKIDVARRPDVAVRADREPACEGVPDSEPIELGMSHERRGAHRRCLEVDRLAKLHGIHLAPRNELDCNLHLTIMRAAHEAGKRCSGAAIAGAEATAISWGMRYTVTLALMAGISGCGGDPATTGGVDAGLRDGAAPGEMCASSSDCRGTLVCATTSHTCVERASCTAHADCGLGAYCDPAAMSCVHSGIGSPCGTSDNCPTGDMCVGGFCGCSGDSYGASSVPPNVLIVLDRSSSMNEMIPGGTKWEIAKAAIASLLAAYGTRARFGLALYPGTDEPCDTGARCGPGHVFVDPGLMTDAMINGVLGRAATCSFGTPTAEMLATLPTYTPLHDTMRPNYVLLITDGMATCDDPVPAVAALRATMPDVKTFVVGFGGGVDPMQLAGMAMAGGAARPGAMPYYQADDAMSFGDALTAIAGAVLTCTFTLSAAPPDLTMLYVYVDRMPVARDTSHAAGWDYDSMTNQVTFYGATCDSLRGGTTTGLAIVYGCPTSPF